MLLHRKSIGSAKRGLVDFLMAPVSPKNLRLSAMLVSIYQLLIAFVMLFIVLLALAHGEQMKTMLRLDIEDQKDNGFYDMSPFHNQIRLQSASQLANVTEMFLYIFTGIVSVFLLSSISLFFGVYKNRSEFVLPWLLVEFILVVAAVIFIFWMKNEKFVQVIGGKLCFLTLCAMVVMFDGLMWYIIHTFYQSLRTMNKLREIATVAIPCPAPGAIPFHFRRENMYLGSNGYKHILTESPDGTY